MLEEILDTKVKIKIASLLARSRESYTVSDVSRTLKISKSRAGECLRELYQNGILERRVVGRSILYRLAANNLAKAIERMLNQDKGLISEIERDVKSKLKTFEPVSIVMFGSALKGLKAGSDVDFLVIHEKGIDESSVYKIVAELTEKFGFHISILSLSLNEFVTKARKGEEFILNVMATHKLIFGKELEKLVWQGK
jgi:predicted DNA-binding transcriptional regulator